MISEKGGCRMRKCVPYQRQLFEKAQMIGESFRSRKYLERSAQQSCMPFMKALFMVKQQLKMQQRKSEFGIQANAGCSGIDFDGKSWRKAESNSEML
jgi:hypothetical protein